MKQNNGVVILDLLPSHNFSMGKLGLGQQLYYSSATSKLSFITPQESQNKKLAEGKQQ